SASPDLDTPTAGIALADEEISTLDLAAACVTIAADGVWHRPHVVESVVRADGAVLYRAAGDGEPWTAGFTPTVSTAVWMGTATNSPIRTTNEAAVRAARARAGRLRRLIRRPSGPVAALGHRAYRGRHAARSTADEPVTDTSAGPFEVVAWPAERRLVLYVPAIEAATSVTTMAEAQDAARCLIAELTGLPSDAISCSIRLRRSPGMLGGSTPLA
ncbi:MAG: hypothetical protein L0H84_06600, partial [Pseudonocardia sp.]|nr:hypothetical protein [Pseudonocardia sp.]